MRAKFINENIGDVLKPKSKEEIKRELDNIMKKIKVDFFTVGDLKKILENVPDNLPVGKSGHFGEFNPMDKGDFWVTTSRPVPKNRSWGSALNIDMPILEITSPDIGPDPD